MVRMSDLVRGIGREAPAPATPGPTERPATEAAADTPAVVSAERVSLASAAAEALPAVEPVASLPPGESAEALFRDLREFVGQVRGVLHGGGPFPWSGLRALVDRATTALARSADLFWVANNPVVPSDVDYLAFHQARVCVLALRLGTGLAYDRERLASLGQAAAVFDVALWQLPETILRRGDALTGEELAMWRAHPRTSADIVTRWKPDDPHIVRTVLEHHEREQGQGFPQGLPGAAIAPDAKLVALADAYATLTVPPPSRARLKPHEAIREIVKTRNEQFPAALVKALLSEISVFPPGTVVRLNTEEVGQVIAVNRHHPLRPKVEVVADGKGQRLPAPKVIDLSEAPFLYITGPEAGR